MAVYAISTLIVYLITSFLITTTIVRLLGNTPIAKFARRHIYSFPAIPIILFCQFVARICSPLVRTPPLLIRFLFEKLSGKKTLRRHRSGYFKY